MGQGKVLALESKKAKAKGTEPQSEWEVRGNGRRKVGKELGARDKQVEYAIAADRESNVWEKLPVELIDKVFLPIPLSELANKRLVCKEWNRIIIERAGRGYKPVQSLLYWGPRDFFNDSAVVSNWVQTIHNRRIEGKDERVWKSEAKDRPTSFPAPTPGEDVQLMTSEGGLLFFSCCDVKTSLISNLFVCNPLLGHTKRLCLPSPLVSMRSRTCPVPCFLGVEINHDSRSYKLVVAGPDPGGVNTVTPSILNPAQLYFVYDSMTSTWERTAPLPREAKHDPRMTRTFTVIGRSVCSDRRLYWLTSCLSRASTPFIIYIVRYDIEQDRWTRTMTNFHYAARRERGGVNQHIFLCQGGQVAFCSSGKFDFKCKVWREISDVPLLEYQSLVGLGPDCDWVDVEPGHAFWFHDACDLLSRGEFVMETACTTMNEDLSERRKWMTRCSKFFERDPANLFGFSPSLTMRP